MTGVDSIRVGVLAEPYLYEWQVRALTQLKDEPGVDVPLVVTDASSGDAKAESWNVKKRIGFDDVTTFLDVFRREKAWTFVLAARTLARVFGDDQTLWHRHSVDNVDCLSDADHLPCEPRTHEGWNELPADVVARVAEDCDVVVRFGFGLVRGEILTAPEHGVFSFHPADIREYRGMGPPAIFHDGRDRAGSTLQRLDESIDGGEIVAYDEVSLDGCYTLWDVFDRLATVQIRLLADGIDRVRDPTFEPWSVPDDRLGEFYARDTRRTLSFSSRVLAKNLAGRIRRRLERGAATPERIRSKVAVRLQQLKWR
ncbi:formyltransferase family protein [Natrarchaeobius chitinivorans]|uniref:Methionyl-tRNA formyltransferase n=1 Tax=Natrarchaeobius chitinivorans TaxID=1679083 RepID=A0A3N6LVC7_NATCH|nr:formyltransferase family protein [Natrarchaeobius chitinivorans]RQG94388.1 methionyl-tRNA formyltransferase [Natrarchaeobius chitinivorans]